MERGNALKFFVLLLVTGFLLSFMMQVSTANDVLSGIVVGNPEDYTVIYENFKDFPKTTNFSDLSNEQLGDIPNMGLENSFGLVVWRNNVNLTEVADPAIKIIPFDSYIFIQDKSFTINTSYFTNLVGPVNISFYSPQVDNPNILLNGVDCGENCSTLTFANDIYTFNTTLTEDYLNYTLVFDEPEEPSEPPSDSGGDSGSSGSSGSSGGSSGGDSGGGGGPPPTANFTFSPTTLQVKLGVGETASESFTIENTGSLTLNLALSIFEVTEFVTLTETTASLPIGAIKNLVANFAIPEGQESGVYTGRINAEGNGIDKDLNIIVEVTEGPALFDLNSELKKDKITKNQELETTIYLQDVGNVGNVDVLLEYFVQDYNGTEKIKLGEDQVNVDGSEELEKSFTLEEETFPPGEYAFSVALSYEDNKATAANPFSIVDLRLVLITGFVFTMILVSLIAVLVIYTWYKHTWVKQNKKKSVVYGNDNSASSTPNLNKN